MTQEISRKNRARVGVFGIGLAAYWPQFAGLRERLMGYQQEVERRIAAMGAEVVSAGLVDTAPAAQQAGDLFAARMSTSSSATWAPTRPLRRCCRRCSGAGLRCSS